MSGPNDFTTSLAAVISSLEDRIRHGVEQPAEFSVIFSSNIRTYPLPSNAISVTQVTGMVMNLFTQFEDGKDYIFSGESLVWQGTTALPDEGSRLDIEYTYRELASGLTDFNPGSVAGTILRAVAREMTLLYAQMDQAYRRAFIDEATGVALDNVVALLGVQRIPALKAKGTATFLLKKPATKTVGIPRNTRIADQSGRIFLVLDKDSSIPIQTEEFQTPKGTTVTTRNKIAEVIGVYRKSDTSATPAALPIAATFGADERNITFTTSAPGEAVRIQYKPKSVTVAIEAADPGPDGNVNANSITLMPTPPPGVDGVTNEDPTQGGQDAEADSRLRDRAKHALEQAGNATINSIKFAVMAVKGVEGVVVIDNETDNSVPLGEVRVRYSGGDVNEVKKAVEKTRAAGVVVRIDEIRQVFITGTFYLIPSQQPSPDAGGTFVDAVTEFINGLAIGMPLPIRRLNSFAFGISGLADVAEAQLQSHTPNPSSQGVNITVDPLLISGAELVRAASGAIQVVFLQALNATANAKAGAGYTIDVQINDAQGAPVKFNNFSLDINVLARATLQANPSQAPVRVGLFTKPVQFQNSTTGKLAITVTTDLKDFSAATHTQTVEFQLTAAAYPVLQSARRSFDVTV